jgi:hypothetical protein
LGPAEWPGWGRGHRGSSLPRPGQPAALELTTPAGPPVRRTRFFPIWRPAAAAAGLGAGVTFHDLRHHYASLLIRHGENIKVMQSRLGTGTPWRRWTPTRTCGRTPRTGPARRSTRSSAGRPARPWRSESMWPPLCPRRAAAKRSPRSDGWCRGSQPVSRLLSPGRSRGGGHPSGTGVAAGLVRSTRGLGRASLRAALSRPYVPYSTLLRVGFT